MNSVVCFYRVGNEKINLFRLTWGVKSVDDLDLNPGISSGK